MLDVCNSVQGCVKDRKVSRATPWAAICAQALEQTCTHLHQVVEDAQAVRVLALLHLHERAQLGGGEGDVRLAQDDLQLLAAHLVWRRPVGVILFEDLWCQERLSMPEISHASAR